MKTTIFTLAPADHSTDPMVLETGHKIWSTYKKVGNTYLVMSNRKDTAGGHVWHPIAEKVNGIWRIESGAGYFGQGGALLARYLISKRAKVRSAVTAYQGKVKRRKATAKVYSLPSLLNGGKAVVSRDKLADMRAAKRKRSLAELIAEREKRKEGAE